MHRIWTNVKLLWACHFVHFLQVFCNTVQQPFQGWMKLPIYIPPPTLPPPPGIRVCDCQFTLCLLVLLYHLLLVEDVSVTEKGVERHTSELNVNMFRRKSFCLYKHRSSCSHSPVGLLCCSAISSSHFVNLRSVLCLKFARWEKSIPVAEIQIKIKRQATVTSYWQTCETNQRYMYEQHKNLLPKWFQVLFPKRG